MTAAATLPQGTGAGRDTTVMHGQPIEQRLSSAATFCGVEDVLSSPAALRSLRHAYGQSSNVHLLFRCVRWVSALGDLCSNPATLLSLLPNLNNHLTHFVCNTVCCRGSCAV
jgi:hypothetical protein